MFKLTTEQQADMFILDKTTQYFRAKLNNIKLEYWFIKTYYIQIQYLIKMMTLHVSFKFSVCKVPLNSP